MALTSQREIARRFPYYRGEAVDTHPAFPPTSGAKLQSPDEPYSFPASNLTYTLEDDALIEDWARGQVATAYHAISTCPMRARGEGGVVDAKLDVYGVKRFKVAGEL